MTEESILIDAHEIVTGREKGYGDPVDSAERVAIAFTAITGRELFSRDIALVQILFKQVRSEHKYKRDNMLDAAGYTEIRERCLLKEYHSNSFKIEELENEEV